MQGQGERYAALQAVTGQPGHVVTGARGVPLNQKKETQMNDTITTAEQEARTARIRQLNDVLRTSWMTGKVLLTEGIQNLPDATRSRVAEAVETFSDFTPDNDPYGEHDFGAVTIDGHKIFWKIDYYAPDMMHGSEDPSDPKQTRRVLTIMLAREY